MYGDSQEDRLAWQYAYYDYKDRLVGAAFAEANYSGAEFDTIGHRLIIRGTGEPSPAVAAIIADAPEGIIASWESVPHSFKELDRVQAQAFRASSTVATARMRPDFTGVVVEYVATSAASARVRNHLPRRLQGVPVSYKRVSGYLDTFDSRSTGSAPFKGGSRFGMSYNNRGCSTGTVVETASNNQVMLTAHHCFSVAGATPGTTGGVVGVDATLLGDQTNIGTSTTIRSQQWDIQAIDGKNYSTAVWLGGANTNQLLNYVTAGAGNASALAFHEMICVSGGYSGSNCIGWVIDASLDWRSCSNPSNSFCDVHDNFVLLGDNAGLGRAIAGEGDSGGTAYIDGANPNVLYAGSISGGDNSLAYQAPCDGIQGRSCSSHVVISPWFRFKDAPALNFHLP